jgi:hypothetical protein
VTQAFNELAELTGMSWWIDENKLLHFRTRTSIIGPPLNNRAIRGGSLRVKKDRQNYRNHQVLRAGAGLTDVRTETFVGDGTRRTFNTSFKMATQPIVTVNGVVQTIGVRQLQTEKTWYWNKNVNGAVPGFNGHPCRPPDVLDGHLSGLFPIIISSQRGPEVAARRAIEGGSGRYSRVEERSNIETIDAAIAAAQACLDRYGSITSSVTCYTDTQDLHQANCRRWISRSTASPPIT